MNSNPQFLRTVLVSVLMSAPVYGLLLTSALAHEEMRMPASAAEHVAEAKRYEEEALSLEKKAAEHAQMARQYSARAGGGDKRSTALRSLAQHCERLAKFYGDAAKEARLTAEAHRRMGNGS